MLHFVVIVVKFDSVSTEDSTTSPDKNVEIATYNISNGFSFKSPDVSFSCQDNFNFLASNFSILLPVSDSINIGISKLKETLDKTPSKFNITGFYTSKEKNTSIFPNLGLARANAVKNYLVENGIPENKLELFDQLKEDLTLKNDTLFGPVNFEWLTFDSKVVEEKDWNTIKKNINANPLILYFKTGQSSIDLTQGQKQKIAEIVNYLNHVEGSKINIVGHTDNQPGVRNTNKYYSEERAKFAKKYFVSNGIAETKIEASGKAESEPIADNATEEGKAKNRRTEVTIK
ncbi:MAG: OmpA family protein [Flavobacterium sp.]|nr:OmpA family protein [Flavobacterium sp.]